MNLKKYCVPKFLLRLDKYLLLNLPFIWRTRVHFLLFYSLVADVVLFGTGLLYPMNLYKLYTDSSAIGKNQVYITMIMVLLSFLTLIYWWNQLSKYKTPIVDGKNIILEWLIYFVSVSAIILNSFMCTWGIECKKAYFTTKNIDYNHSFLTDNQYFRMGYVTHYDADKTNNKAAYFKNGELLMNDIREQLFGKKAHGILSKSTINIDNYSVDNIKYYLEYFAHYTLADSAKLWVKIEAFCAGEQTQDLNLNEDFYSLDYPAEDIAKQLSNQSSFLGNKRLINNINDFCYVKINLAEYMLTQQANCVKLTNNMWLREQFIATLDISEKQAYKKTLSLLNKYPIHWYSSQDDDYDRTTQLVERDALFGWERNILDRFRDSLDVKALMTFAENNKIQLDTLGRFFDNYEYRRRSRVSSSEEYEIERMSYIYNGWRNILRKDSIDRLNPTVKPLVDVFRDLVNQFDTLTFQKYLNYANNISERALIYEESDTTIRSKHLDNIVAQSNKRYDYLKKSEKDSLLLFMNLKGTAAVELYNRLWTKEYSDYVLQKYPLNILEKLNHYHQINGFELINTTDSTFKKQKILVSNNGFISALEMVESAKVKFWNFRPLVFLFCVFGVNITFLLFFLSITSRGVIITSLFILTLLMSCVLLIANVFNAKDYIELFIIGSFVSFGLLLNLLLFFAKSKIRFIEYYIIIAIFMGVMGMMWLFTLGESNTSLAILFREYEKDIKDIFFYFFMVVLFSFALLYKRHLNLPNKK